MRRRKKPENTWLLLALPVVGAAGWVISRLIGSRKTIARRIVPISGPRPAVNNSAGEAQEAAEGERVVEPAAPQSQNQPRETGQKEPVTGTKSATTAAQKITTQREEAPAPRVEAPAAGTYAGHALKNQPERLPVFWALLVPFLILPVAIVLLAFHHIPVQSQPVVPGGDAKQGQVLLQAWGCGSCHTIDGVAGADGTVGPELKGLSNRSYIAGHLRNTPDNMIQWIMHPQEISPGVDMPDSAVPESVARDMAAYLYTIR